ncbi:hypothetical protein JHK86_013521 [Glycine max]|nr:hypothetical protein JHK86_013521 [Glycine max]
MANEMVAKLTKHKLGQMPHWYTWGSSESTCLSNCAHRYIEMSVLVMKRFQSMR